MSLRVEVENKFDRTKRRFTVYHHHKRANDSKGVFEPVRGEKMPFALGADNREDDYLEISLKEKQDNEPSVIKVSKGLQVLVYPNGAQYISIETLDGGNTKRIYIPPKNPGWKVRLIKPRDMASARSDGVFVAHSVDPENVTVGDDGPGG